jgi:hypothetical protein
MVRLVDKSCIGQCTLTLGAHFGEDVAFESVFPLDFARAGVRESLLGAGIGFHFWHRVPL